MQDDLDSKAANLTSFIFQIPSYRRLILLLLVSSFFSGFLLHAIFQVNGEKPFLESFIYGGADGVILFALPAVLASVLATSLLSLSSFRQASKYFLFIGLLSMVITISMYIVGIIIERNFAPATPLAEFVLLSGAVIMTIWFVSLRVPLNFPWYKSLAISLLHPIFQISFLVLWKAYALIEVRSPVLLALQFVVASVILLLSMWSLLVLVNAPAKRNFGISAVQACALFFAQWVKGGKGLEEILAEVGTLVESEAGAVMFRAKNRLKAAFVVPLVHFGPVGNLGGSEYPSLISEELKRRTGGEIFVFHGTVGHDFNPVFSSSHLHVSEMVGRLLESAGGYERIASYWSSTNGKTRVHMLGFGKNAGAFLSVTRAPSNTDDIELSLGLSLKNKAMALGFKEAIVVDMHNSKADGLEMTAGSRSYYELSDAIGDLRKSSFGRISLGLGVDPLNDFSARQGIGKAGLKVAVFQAGKKRVGIILFDANNALPIFRAHILDSLKGFHFDFVDIYTTDSHSVNTISGVHNPLGLNVQSAELVSRVKAAVQAALNDLEPVSVKVSSTRIKLHVLGQNRTSELVSTVNAIVAVLRIMAPAIIIGSLLLAFATLVYLGRLVL